MSVLPNIVAFIIGLSIAYFLEWRAADLVWSLWLCSLVLGYATLLAALAGAAIIGLNLLHQDAIPAKHRTTAIMGGAVTGLFFLGFFSIHFCGFHAGHSVFLQQFFPISGIPAEGFGEAFMNPPLLWLLASTHLLPIYGVFLIPALIAERKHLLSPLFNAINTVRNSQLSRPEREAGKRGGHKLLGDVMKRPYLNVIRMHLLIFFFAFCHFMQLESFIIYAAIYCVYFFPWKEIKMLKQSKAVS